MPSPYLPPVNNSNDDGMAGTSQSSVDSDQSSDLLSQSSNHNNNNNEKVDVEISAAAAPRLSDGTNICHKSHAATRPSEGMESNVAEFNSIRKRDVDVSVSPVRQRGNGNYVDAMAQLVANNDDMAFADEEGGVGDDDDNIMKSSPRGMRLYDKDKNYSSKAHATAAVKKSNNLAPTPSNDQKGEPSSKKLSSKKSSSDKKQHPLLRKFEKLRESTDAAKKEESPMIYNNQEGSNNNNNNSPSSSQSSDPTNPLLPNEGLDINAPEKFRESYESKNAHSQKNLNNIDAIARNKEAALNISREVEVVCPLIAGDGVLEVEGVEEFGEMSPLTQMPSQVPLGWGEGMTQKEEEVGEDEDSKKKVGTSVREENGGGDVQFGKWNEVENVQKGEEDDSDHWVKDGGDVQFDGGNDNGDFEAVNNGEETSPVEAGDMQPKKGTLLSGYKRTVLKGGGQDEVNNARKPPPKHPAMKKNKPTARALDVSKKPPPPPPAAKRKKGRGNAALAALAAEEDEEPEPMDTSNEHDNDEIKHKKGKKRKVNKATELALEELAEIGTVDSYAANSKAREERKAHLLALASDEAGKGGTFDDGGRGHTSFNCDDDDDDELRETEKQQSESLLENETEKQQSESLFGDTEKQSESLLSSSAPPVEPAAMLTNAAVANRAEQLRKHGANLPPDASHDTIQAREKMIVAVRKELQNMNQTLRCLICQGTVKDSVMYPCTHAFCGGCHHNYYNPPRQPPKKKGEKQSPPRVVKNECPHCKQPNPGRRAVIRAQHLDELAKAYKKMENAFGFAPLKHHENMPMTQLDPVEDGMSYEDTESDEDEEEYGRKMPAAKRKKSDLHELEEHLQVARVVKEVLIAQPDMKYEAKGQDAVIRADLEDYNKEMKKSGLVDESSISKDAKRVDGETQMVAAAEVANERRNDDATLESSAVMESSSAETLDNTEKAGNYVSSTNDAKAKANDENADPEQNDLETEAVAASERLNNLEVEHDEGKENESTVEEEEFYTATEGANDGPDASQYSTARDESQTTSSLNMTAPSPTVLHDGNTVKKADRLRLREGTNVQDLERSPEALRRARESMATAATSSSSPIVLHDGNTAKKAGRPEEQNLSQSAEACAKRMRNRGSLGSIEDDADDDPTPRRSGKMSPLPAVALTVKQAEKKKDEDDIVMDDIGRNGEGNLPAPRLAAPDAAAASIATRQAKQKEKQIIVKGSIVVVEARTWPGINKPGGTARVTKVHNGGNSTKYDVAYVLGGREKQVDESFVTLQEVNELSTIEEGPDDSMMTSGSAMSAEKKRPVRQRRAATKAEPPAAPVPIYNDEELKQIPSDVLQWAGIVPKKGKGKKAKSVKIMEPQKEAGKKRALKDSNAKPKSKPAKKQKATKKSDSPLLAEQDDVLEGLSEVLSSLSTEEVVNLADARYSSLLSLDKKQSSSETQILLYAVTSSLTDNDSKTLDLLCKLLKEKSGKLSLTYLALLLLFHHVNLKFCLA